MPEKIIWKLQNDETNSELETQGLGFQPTLGEQMCDQACNDHTSQVESVLNCNLLISEAESTPSFVDPVEPEGNSGISVDSGFVPHTTDHEYPVQANAQNEDELTSGKTSDARIPHDTSNAEINLAASLFVHNSTQNPTLPSISKMQ